jgi:4-amino-4-deoxy-L-arabinose transferase-like glycosyltransferase
MSSTDPRGSRRLCTLVMLLVLVLAFGLRVYHLDFQSFWTDEGRSLMRASVPLGQVAAATPVEHMPTYFALLHLWIDLAGASDFAVRFLSVWPSLLAIALAYGLAVDLGSTRSGLIAALLLATGGFQIWYAQEARMYTWLLATSLCSTWLLWRLLSRWPAGKGNARGAEPQAPWGAVWPHSREFYLTFAGYVLATAATIYLHHFGFVVPLAHAIFALLWLAFTRDLRAFLRWVAAGFGVLLLYLPAASRVLGITSYGGWRQTIVPIAQIPLYFLTAYVAGDTMPAPWHTWLPWLYLALIVAGTVAWWRANRLGGLLLLLMVVVPVAVVWAVPLIKPQFHERYTMLVTGPLVLLAANGFSVFDPTFWAGKSRPENEPSQPRARSAWQGRAVAGTGRHSPFLIWLAAGVLAGVIGANGLALYHLYDDSAVQKPDYRAVAARIQDGEIPGDVILTFTTSWEDTFLHYYHGSSPIRDMLPVQHARSWELAFAAVRDATAGAQRAWLVEHYGGAKSVRAWLARNAWLASEFDSNGLHLALYGLKGLPQVELPAQLPFGTDLLLDGLTLAGGAGNNGVTFHAGDVVGVTPHWQVLKSMKPLEFSLRLLDSTGRSFVVTDYLPEASTTIRDRWQPGGLQQDLRGILLSPDLPPGLYQISLILYDPDTGAVMPAGDKPSAHLAEIQVLSAAVPPQPRTLPIPVRLQATMGEELELLGFGVEPDPARPEATDTLYLWWRALRQPTQAYQVQAELVGGNGETIAGSLQPLSSTPTDTWHEGQIIGERYPLVLDPGAVSGEYQLRLALAAPDGAAVSPSLGAGEVTVKARPRTYHLPLAGHPLDMKLGQDIVLRKYSLDRPVTPEDELHLTLYWQADDRITGQYKVFVHLVDDTGRIIAQHDGIPADGAAPTESWRKGEVIADTHVLTVPAAGHYRLLTGLYDPVSGQRLPVWDKAQQPVADAAIVVTDVQVPQAPLETPDSSN